MEPPREIEHAIGEITNSVAPLLSCSDENAFFATNPRARFNSLTLERDESRALIGLIDDAHLFASDPSRRAMAHFLQFRRATSQ